MAKAVQLNEPAEAAEPTMTTFRSFSHRLSPPQRRCLKSILGVKDVDALIPHDVCVAAHASAFKGAR